LGQLSWTAFTTTIAASAGDSADTRDAETASNPSPLSSCIEPIRPGSRLVDLSPERCPGAWNVI
jgi:hypothetical protein